MWRLARQFINIISIILMILIQLILYRGVAMIQMIYIIIKLIILSMIQINTMKYYVVQQKLNAMSLILKMDIIILKIQPHKDSKEKECFVDIETRRAVLERAGILRKLKGEILIVLLLFLI